MSMAIMCPYCSGITNAAGSCISMTCPESIYQRPQYHSWPPAKEEKEGLTEDDLRRVLREVIREEIKSLKPTDWSSLTDWKRNAK